MGIRTHLGTSKGSYDENTGASGPTDVVIESAPGGTTGMLTTDTNGKVSASNLATRIRYEFWDHTVGGQSVPTASYTYVKVDGQADHVDDGLSTWNTSSFVFRPEAIGNVYTLRFSGKLANPSKNGVVHLDFALSGANPPNYVPNYNRQKQAREFQVANSQDHVDLLGVFTVFVDQALFVSGGQFYVTSNINGGINMVSASLFIKEG